jgi:hypothetical protein
MSKDLGKKSLEDPPQQIRVLKKILAALTHCDPQLISMMKSLLNSELIYLMIVEELIKIWYIKKWPYRMISCLHYKEHQSCQEVLLEA